MIEAEVWLIACGDGQCFVGNDEESATEDANEAGAEGTRRLVRLTIILPEPKTTEVKITIPEADDGKIKVKIENA